jgi:hypothetical protein
MLVPEHLTLGVRALRPTADNVGTVAFRSSVEREKERDQLYSNRKIRKREHLCIN